MDETVLQFEVLKISTHTDKVTNCYLKAVIRIPNFKQIILQKLSEKERTERVDKIITHHI